MIYKFSNLVYNFILHVAAEDTKRIPTYLHVLIYIPTLKRKAIKIRHCVGEIIII